MPQGVVWKVEIAPNASLVEPSPAWIDVTPEVNSFSWQRGRQSQLDEYETGSASVGFKAGSRVFDPTNSSGPYATARLMMPMRIGATYASTYWPQFRGFVQNWPVKWTTRYTQEVTISCLDATCLLAMMKSSWIYNTLMDEPVGSRIMRCLDQLQGGVVSWPTSMRDIDLTGPILAGPHSSTAMLGRIREASAATLTPLFIDRRGIYYRGNGRNQGYVFKDVGTASDLIYLSADFSDNSVDRVVTYAIVTGKTGAPKTATNSASGSLTTGYGPRGHERTVSVLKNDADALALASAIVAEYGLPRPRVTIDVKPYRSAALVAACLDIDCEDAIGLQRTSFAAGGASYAVAGTDVLSLSHKVTGGGADWDAQYVIDGDPL